MKFEELQVEQSFMTPTRTVREADIAAFADLSGDDNPIHFDVEHGKLGRFGRPIAHGVFGLAITTGLIDELGVFRDEMVAMLGIEDWRFNAPIFAGDEITVRVSIDELRRTRSGPYGIVGRRIEVRNQTGAIVQSGRISVMVHAQQGYVSPSEGPDLGGEAKGAH